MIAVLGAVIFSFDFWLFVVLTAGVYAVLALGLQLEYGHAGLLNFGHIGFAAIGAYTMGLLVHHYETGLFPAAIAGVVAAMIAGLLVALPAVRLRSDYLAITTIAFSEIIRIMVLNQTDITRGPRGLFGFARDFTGRAGPDGELEGFVPSVGGALEGVTGWEWDKDRVLFLLVWVLFVLGWLFLRRMTRSPWGRVLRSIREDEDAANALGKNPFSYKLQVMAVGSAFGGLGGVLLALNFLLINPTMFEPLFTFYVWVIILISGTARLGAVALGATVFGVIFAGTRFFDFWPFSLLDAPERSAVRLILIGLMLISIMAFRPQGFFGKKEELLLDR